MSGFTVRRLPFRKLALGTEESIQIEFVSDGLEVRFPALISITRINQRHQQVASRFIMIDPRGERLMLQAQAADGHVEEAAPAAETPEANVPPILDEQQQAAAHPSQPAQEKPQATGNLNISPAPATDGHHDAWSHGHAAPPHGLHHQPLFQERQSDFDEEGEFINPLVIAYRALRDRWAQAAVAFMVLGAVMATAAWLVIDPIFQSRGLIRIAAKEPKILYAERDDSRLRLFDAFVSSELTYLTSRPVLDRALYLLNREPEPPRDVAQTVDELEQRLAARKMQSMLELTADSIDRDSAKVMVNAVLDAYQQMHVEQLDQRQTIRERELIAREQELLTRLDQLYAVLLNVGGEHDATTVRATHKLRLEQIEEARTTISDIEASLRQLADNGKIIGDGSLDASIQRAVMQDRTLADLSFERTKRAANLSTLRERYAEKHPSVAFAAQELAIIDAAIDERYQLINRLGESGGLSSGAGDTEQSSEQLNEMMAVQEARLVALLADAERLNAKLIDVTAIDDDINENRTMLQETRRALEKVRVESRNSLPGSIEILSRGSVPAQPTINRRKTAAGLAVVMAFGATLTGFVGFYMLRRRVGYSDELASIDGVELIGVVGTMDEMDSMAPPAVNHIRAELEIGIRKHTDRARAIVVAPVSEGTNCAPLTMQLAQSFAGAGTSTLMIDGDFKPRLSSLANVGEQDSKPALISDIPEPLFLSPILSIIPGGGHFDYHRPSMSVETTQTMIRNNRKATDCLIYQGNRLTTDVLSRFVVGESDAVVLVVNRDDKLSDLERQVEATTRLTKGPIFVVLVNASANDPAFRNMQPELVATPANDQSRSGAAA
ncbi:MAG: hypothetical protein KI792_04780 [Alphaproteobacteria bacterium]|nr:hypothetical protein [Alphaproteobacteria bacterium SS10]